jgi:hypothetical protein
MDSGLVDSRAAPVALAASVSPDPAEPLDHDNPVPRAERIAFVVVGAVTVVLLWSRLADLDTSLWHDEAFTVMTYVRRGPVSMLFGYYDPNNHLLFSLLAWATARTIGDGEAAYRIWSVMPALGAVALLGWWARWRLGLLAAVAVVVLATMSPTHLELAPQVRGYGLGFLAGAGMLVTAARVCDRGQVLDVSLFAGFGLVGIWTLPQVVLAFVACTIVLLVVRRDLRRPVLVAFGLVGMLSLLFYAPVMSEMLRSSQKDYGAESLPWYGWVSAPLNDLARPTLAILSPVKFTPSRLSSSPTTGGPLLAGACIMLVGLGCRRLWRTGDRALLALVLVPVIATYSAIVAARFYFMSRFGSFLLFHVIVLLALGIVELWDLVRPHGAPFRIASAAVATALIVAGSLNIARQTHDLPYEQFQLAGELIDGSKIERVVTNSVRPAGLQHYLGRERVETVDTSTLVRLFCFDPGPLVFVAHHNFDAEEPDLSCLRARKAVSVHLVGSRRGSMDIWMLRGGEDAAVAEGAFVRTSFCNFRDDALDELKRGQKLDLDALNYALAKLEELAPTRVREQAKVWADLLLVGLSRGEPSSSPEFQDASQAIERFCRD